MSLSDAIAGYYFWMWAGKPWDMNEVRQFFFERKLKRLLKQGDVNATKYETLLKVRR